MVIEGWRGKSKFSAPLEYGHLWHTCEEAVGQKKDWKKPLKTYAEELVARHPDNAEEIEKWFQICKVQFPVYQGWWKDHLSPVKRTPIAHELVFEVPYTLAAGRTVILKGKLDGVSLMGRSSIYQQENKSKGDIDEQKIAGDLPFNLQTMMYTKALEIIKGDKAYADKYPQFKDVWWKKSGRNAKIAGVLYNVIKRPLSDWRGKFNITQRKGRMIKGKRVGTESSKQFYRRLGKLIENNPKDFFYRVKIELIQADIDRFVSQCLNPVLHQLCDWWDWIEQNPMPPACFENSKVHFRMPHGVYNPILEERKDLYYNYLRTGSTANLERVSTLFRELE